MANRATYNIRVVNMSLGALAVDSYKIDPLCLAVRRLSDAGVVVVAAAGNNGKDADGNEIYGHIHSPGNEPSAITVGASNSFGTDVRSDDDVTTYSSRGPTRSFWTDAAGLQHFDNLIKPDLVAPGNKLVSARAEGNAILAAHPELAASQTGVPETEMMYLSGTSMSTPVVSGAVALMLQTNPKLTPNLVKTILMYTAQPISGRNMLQQGAGELNIEGAVRVTRLVKSTLPTTLGATLLTTSTVPTPTSTIAGQTFGWSQGILAHVTSVRGSDLVMRYQKVYAKGVLLGDGMILGSSTAIADPLMMTVLSLSVGGG